MRHRKGFTLIELLVVIAIIVMLMALLSVLVKGVVEKSRNAKTYATIKMLDEGCQRYRTQTGGFPPRTPYSDARCLHFYLGKDLKIPTGRDRETGSPTGWKIMKPPVQFTADMLDLPSGRESLSPLLQPPVPVMDAWGKAIKYKPFPGSNNTSSVDIWSLGKEDSDTKDDITNWAKEF